MIKNRAMKLFIKLFGILILVLGLSLLIKPEFIFGWMEDNMENKSLYIIAILVRLVFGIFFIMAAKESKYPGVIKFFGYLFIIAAIIFIFIGHESFKHLIASMIPDFKPYAPVSGLIGMVLGGLLVYAFSGNKEISK